MYKHNERRIQGYLGEYVKKTQFLDPLEMSEPIFLFPNEERVDSGLKC